MLLCRRFRKSLIKARLEYIAGLLNYARAAAKDLFKIKWKEIREGKIY